MSKSTLYTPLDRTAETTLYRQIEEKLENYIRQHDLPEGSQIPSLRTLANALGTNGLTIRRALRELSHRGMLVSRQGRGTFVCRHAARPKVLWVCAADLFGGDISPYYLLLLERCQAECAAVGFTLVPLWLGASDSSQAEAYCTDDHIREYAGFMFITSRTHPLLQYIQERHLNHVHLTCEQEVRPRTVNSDYAGAIQIGVEELVKRGHTDISVFEFGDLGGIPAASLRDCPIATDCIQIPTYRRMSECERAGYIATRQLLEAGRLRHGIFVLDDIVAKGVTRALLAHCSAPADTYDIIILTVTQLVIPAGLPVTYLTYDVNKMVEAMARILVDQIRGSTEGDSHYLCKYTIHSDTADCQASAGDSPIHIQRRQPNMEREDETHTSLVRPQ